MITGRQIRAARGLLEWKAEDLAKKAGTTRVTISKIESDLVQPQEKTLTRILAAFDKHGVEFLEDEGVKIRKQNMRIYSGKAGYRQLLDHIYETLKDGGRIRQFNFGDERYLPYADNFVSEHTQRMGEIDGLDAQVLAIKGEVNLPLAYCEYRTLDKAYAVMAPYYIYDDYLVMSLNESSHKKEFITIHSKFLTERYVQEFELFWSKADTPAKRRGK
ncbi:MAG: helix-turn-helix transcriptional regulator [Alphaproteobacteria bacterium]|nr:helix-turn-helix transcriptional regulator [Alphaproteobacteria bacterium]